MKDKIDLQFTNSQLNLKEKEGGKILIQCQMNELKFTLYNSQFMKNEPRFVNQQN